MLTMKKTFLPDERMKQMKECREMGCSGAEELSHSTEKMMMIQRVMRLLYKFFFKVVFILSVKLCIAFKSILIYNRIRELEGPAG